jgi:hypothetical protein
MYPLSILINLSRNLLADGLMVKVKLQLVIILLKLHNGMLMGFELRKVMSRNISNNIELIYYVSIKQKLTKKHLIKCQFKL